MLEYLGAK